MQKLIIQADRFFLDKLTSYVKYWVEKHDYEKHKIDFLIQVERINLYFLIIFAAFIPAIIFIIERNFVAAGVQVAIWAALGGSKFLLEQKITSEMKEYYDVVFALRKEPEFCVIYKEVLENLFLESQDRRSKITIAMLFMEAWIIGLLFLLAYLTNFANPTHIVAIYIALDTITSVIHRYIIYVYDMDEPTQKEEAKESITDIVRREWEQLIGGLSPTPNFT